MRALVWIAGSLNLCNILAKTPKPCPLSGALDIDVTTKAIPSWIPSACARAGDSRALARGAASCGVCGGVHACVAGGIPLFGQAQLLDQNNKEVICIKLAMTF